jgi:hypothetical protein
MSQARSLIKTEITDQGVNEWAASVISGEQTYHTFLGTAPTRPQIPPQLLGFEYVKDADRPDDCHRWPLDSYDDLLLLANSVDREELINLLQEHWFKYETSLPRYLESLKNDPSLAEWLGHGARQDFWNWLHHTEEQDRLIFRDKQTTRYIGYYRHDSHCGGPEEGGWYYSTDTLTSWTSEVCTYDMADALAHAMTERLLAKRGKFWSGGSYAVIDTIPHQLDQQRPHYE